MAYVVRKRYLNPTYSSNGFVMVQGILLPQNEESTEFTGGLYLIDPLLGNMELTPVSLCVRNLGKQQGLESKLILPFAQSRLQRQVLPQVRLEYFRIEEITEENILKGIISSYVPLPESRAQFGLPLLYCAIDRHIALPRPKIKLRR